MKVYTVYYEYFKKVYPNTPIFRELYPNGNWVNDKWEVFSKKEVANYSELRSITNEEYNRLQNLLAKGKLVKVLEYR